MVKGIIAVALTTTAVIGAFIFTNKSTRPEQHAAPAPPAQAQAPSQPTEAPPAQAPAPSQPTEPPSVPIWLSPSDEGQVLLEEKLYKQAILHMACIATEGDDARKLDHMDIIYDKVVITSGPAAGCIGWINLRANYIEDGKIR